MGIIGLILGSITHKPKRNTPTRLLLSSLLLLIASLPSHANEQAATILFDGTGLTISGNNTSQLSLRLVGPERTLVSEQRTQDSQLSWQMTGYETDGQYRYEIISVTDTNGHAQQHNLRGSFEISEGQLIAPPVRETAINEDDLPH